MSSTSVTDEITILAPDDFHQHLRDGSELLRGLLTHASRQFNRVLVMPNLQPPVRTVADATNYRDRIVSALPNGPTPLMTVYLTDSTTYIHCH